MTTIGIFDIEESFNITGRGIVLVGHRNDCIPKVGMCISIIVNDKIEVFKIFGISIGNRPKNDKDQFGLLIQTTPAMTKYIAENKITAQVANLLLE